MKQHTKATRTLDGTLISVDEMEEMAFQEHQLMQVDRKAGLYRYTDNGGVHYVAPMEPEFPVDSSSHTLPDGRTVIGKDAYEAEMVKAVFEEPVRTPKPGDVCRLLGDFKVEHWECDEHPDGVVTDARTGKVMKA